MSTKLRDAVKHARRASVALEDMEADTVAEFIVQGVFDDYLEQVQALLAIYTHRAMDKAQSVLDLQNEMRMLLADEQESLYGKCLFALKRMSEHCVAQITDALLQFHATALEDPERFNSTPPRPVRPPRLMRKASSARSLRFVERARVIGLHHVVSHTLFHIFSRTGVPHRLPPRLVSLVLALADRVFADVLGALAADVKGVPEWDAMPMLHCWAGVVAHLALTSPDVIIDKYVTLCTGALDDGAPAKAVLALRMLSCLTVSLQGQAQSSALLFLTRVLGVAARAQKHLKGSVCEVVQHVLMNVAVPASLEKRDGMKQWCDVVAALYRHVRSWSKKTKHITTTYPSMVLLLAVSGKSLFMAERDTVRDLLVRLLRDKDAKMRPRAIRWLTLMLRFNNAECVDTQWIATIVTPVLANMPAIDSGSVDVAVAFMCELAARGEEYALTNMLEPLLREELVTPAQLAAFMTLSKLQERGAAPSLDGAQTAAKMIGAHSISKEIVRKVKILNRSVGVYEWTPAHGEDKLAMDCFAEALRVLHWACPQELENNSKVLHVLVDNALHPVAAVQDTAALALMNIVQLMPDLAEAVVARMAHSLLSAPMENAQLVCSSVRALLRIEALCLDGAFSPSTVRTLVACACMLMCHVNGTVRHFGMIMLETAHMPESIVQSLMLAGRDIMRHAHPDVFTDVQLPHVTSEEHQLESVSLVSLVASTEPCNQGWWTRCLAQLHTVRQVSFHEACQFAARVACRAAPKMQPGPTVTAADTKRLDHWMNLSTFAISTLCVYQGVEDEVERYVEMDALLTSLVMGLSHADEGVRRRSVVALSSAGNAVWNQVLVKLVTVVETHWRMLGDKKKNHSEDVLVAALQVLARVCNGTTELSRLVYDSMLSLVEHYAEFLRRTSLLVRWDLLAARIHFCEVLVYMCPLLNSDPTRRRYLTTESRTMLLALVSKWDAHAAGSAYVQRERDVIIQGLAALSDGKEKRATQSLSNLFYTRSESLQRAVTMAKLALLRGAHQAPNLEAHIAWVLEVIERDVQVLVPHVQTAVLQLLMWNPESVAGVLPHCYSPNAQRAHIFFIAVSSVVRELGCKATGLQPHHAVHLAVLRMASSVHAERVAAIKLLTRVVNVDMQVNVDFSYSASCTLKESIVLRRREINEQLVELLPQLTHGFLMEGVVRFRNAHVSQRAELLENLTAWYGNINLLTPAGAPCSMGKHVIIALLDLMHEHRAAFHNELRECWEMLCTAPNVVRIVDETLSWIARASARCADAQASLDVLNTGKASLFACAQSHSKTILELLVTEINRKKHLPHEVVQAQLASMVHTDELQQQGLSEVQSGSALEAGAQADAAPDTSASASGVASASASTSADGAAQAQRPPRAPARAGGGSGSATSIGTSDSSGSAGADDVHGHAHGHTTPRLMRGLSIHNVFARSRSHSDAVRQAEQAVHRSESFKFVVRGTVLIREDVSLAMLVEIIPLLQEKDVLRHLTTLLHSAVLGLDSRMEVFVEHCKNLLVNVLELLMNGDKDAIETGPLNLDDMEELQKQIVLEELHQRLLHSAKPNLWMAGDSQSGAHVQELVMNIVELLDDFDLLRDYWANVAMSWATSSSASHYIVRSLQVFRALHARVSSATTHQLFSRVASLLSGDYARNAEPILEHVITLRTIIRQVEKEKLADFPELFWGILALMDTPYVDLYLLLVQSLEAFVRRYTWSPENIVVLQRRRMVDIVGLSVGDVPLACLVKGLCHPTALDDTMALLSTLASVPVHPLFGNGDLALATNIVLCLPQVCLAMSGNIHFASGAKHVARGLVTRMQDDLPKLAKVFSRFASGVYVDMEVFLLALHKPFAEAFFPLWESAIFRVLVHLLSRGPAVFRPILVALVDVLLRDVDFACTNVDLKGMFGVLEGLVYGSLWKEVCHVLDVLVHKIMQAQGDKPPFVAPRKQRVHLDVQGRGRRRFVAGDFAVFTTSPVKDSLGVVRVVQRVIEMMDPLGENLEKSEPSTPRVVDGDYVEEESDDDDEVVPVGEAHELHFGVANEIFFNPEMATPEEPTIEEVLDPTDELNNQARHEADTDTPTASRMASVSFGALDELARRGPQNSLHSMLRVVLEKGGGNK